MIEDACFYILDTRQVVGNCALWWCADGQGYTCDFAKAGLYTRAEAFNKRQTDVPVHRDVAQAAAVQHVLVEKLYNDDDTRERLQAASNYRSDEEARRDELSESDLIEALEVNPFDDDDDPVDLILLRDEIVTAAKAHACHDCKRPIREGLRHRCRVETSGEDGVQQFRWCHACTKLHVGYPYGEEEKAMR